MTSVVFAVNAGERQRSSEVSRQDVTTTVAFGPPAGSYQTASHLQVLFFPPTDFFESILRHSSTLSRPKRNRKSITPASKKQPLCTAKSVSSPLLFSFSTTPSLDWTYASTLLASNEKCLQTDAAKLLWKKRSRGVQVLQGWSSAQLSCVRLFIAGPPSPVKP